MTHLVPNWRRTLDDASIVSWYCLHPLIALLYNEEHTNELQNFANYVNKQISDAMIIANYETIESSLQLNCNAKLEIFELIEKWTREFV